MHHVYDLDRLRGAYFGLKRDAAPGVDGETWREYGEQLEEKIKDLCARLNGVVGFQHETEARWFWADLAERFAKFGLELHPAKARLLEFGRYAAEDRKRNGRGKPDELGTPATRMPVFHSANRPAALRRVVFARSIPSNGTTNLRQEEAAR